MTKHINPKAIFFDLDGTLCDLDTSVQRAGEYVVPLISERYPHFDGSRFAADRSRVYDEARAESGAGVMQVGRDEFWRRALAYQGITDMAFIVHLAEEYGKVRFANLHLYPESKAVLEALQGHYTLGLITNGPGPLQRGEIAVLDIAHYFPPETIIVAGEVSLLKPDMRIFELARQRASQVGPPCEPTDMLFVGDNQSHDVEAAEAAGWHALWINRYHHHADPPQPPAEGEIHTLHQLWDYLALWMATGWNKSHPTTFITHHSSLTMINLYQLSIFIAVVDEGNFSAAAKKLHMTQAAVSLQIKGLEERYQARLFDRQGHRSVPTERGLALVAPARELLAGAERTEKAIAAPDEHQLAGRLTIGVAVEGRRWPSLLTIFHRQHTAVTLVATRQPEGEALAALRGGRLDLALLADEPASKQFETLELPGDELVPAVPATHPWATADGREVLHLGEMAVQPLVLPRAGSYVRLAIEDALEERGLNRRDLQPSLELDNIEDVALAVEAGAGLGFISRRRTSPAAIGVSQPFGEDGSASPITIPLSAYLVRSRRTNPSAVAAAFWSYAAEELAAPTRPPQRRWERSFAALPLTQPLPQ